MRPLRCGVPARAGAHSRKIRRSTSGWDEYVAGFGVAKEDLPKLLVIDQPGDKFYDAFAAPRGDDAPAALLAHLAAVATGDVAPRHLGWRGFPDRALRFWVANKHTITGALGFAVIVLVMIQRSTADDDKAKGD